MSIDTLFLLNYTACLMMTGLIWLIQLVHYPSFHYISSSKFREFEQFHTQNITYIVLPLMLLELIASIILVVRGFSLFSIINLSTVVALWLVTLLISMPRHQSLIKNYRSETVNSLIRTNWIRTVIWSLRSLSLSSFLLSQI